MSMYQSIFQDGEAGLALLSALGFESTADVGRYRSAWVEKSDAGYRVAVYTRNGGGNRECWSDDDDCRCCGCIISDVLPKHPLYIEDCDDDFDCTYATVYFWVPEGPLAAAILEAEQNDVEFPVVNMSDRWLAAIDAIKG